MPPRKNKKAVIAKLRTDHQKSILRADHQKSILRVDHQKSILQEVDAIPTPPDIGVNVFEKNMGVFETGTELPPDVRFRDIIHPDDHRCDMLYPEALTLIVGVRATCIEKGAQCFTSFIPGEDPLIIALREIIDRKCPMSLVIPISVIGTTHRYEIHDVNDLILPLNLAALIRTSARYLPNGL
jgi:hypothetical protein